MPLVMVSKAFSRAEYESVAEKLAMATDRPDGLVLHAASETDDGEVQIVDVWESAAHAEQFERERLFPAFASTGMMERAEALGRPAAYEPFDYIA